MAARSLYPHARELSFEREGVRRRAVCARLQEDAPGPPVLFLHGNPGRMDDLAEVALRLARPLIAIDLPGFGRSPSPPSARGFRLAEHADDVAALLEAMELREPCVVVGHSHGGGVSHVLAARHPERVAAVVGVGSLGYPAHASYRLLSSPGIEPLAELLSGLLDVEALRPAWRVAFSVAMRPIFAPAQIDPEEIETQLDLFAGRPELIVHMVRLAQGDPCGAVMAAATAASAPTLYLHGEDEHLVPARHVRELHEARQARGHRSELRMLPGGHMLPVYQAPECAAAIDEWIGGLAR